MKKQNNPIRRMHASWLLVLVLQSIATLAADLLLSLSIWLGGFLHALCLWAITPVLGFLSACIATRKGLLNYISLLIPPLAQMAAELILWGYLPQPGPVFLCGLISLIGAATGEVLKRESKNKGAPSWKKI